MIHLMLLIPEGDIAAVESQLCPKLGTVEKDAKIARRFRHKVTGAVYGVICSGAPLAIATTAKDYTLGKVEVKDDKGVVLEAAKPAAFPNVLIEEFSLVHSPERVREIIAAWNVVPEEEYTPVVATDGKVPK